METPQYRAIGIEGFLLYKKAKKGRKVFLGECFFHRNVTSNNCLIRMRHPFSVLYLCGQKIENLVNLLLRNVGSQNIQLL